MYIQTQETPNPHSLKFIPPQVILNSGTLTFNPDDKDINSPLVIDLFNIDGISGVFMSGDFITVTKSPEISWSKLKPIVLSTIMDYLVTGKPVVIDYKKSDEVENDDEITKQIRELIETRVRPAVAQDGGDIIFKDFKDGIVYVELRGSCSGCPSSTMTLKGGIENMLKYYIPEVDSVEPI